MIALAFSITQVWSYNPLGHFDGVEDKITTALIFFAGILDLFLSVILWLILDSDKSPSFLIDRNKVYAVLDVAKPEQPALN